MTRLLAALLICTLAVAVVAAGAKIQSQRDPRFDFSTVKTWAWNPGGAGDVKVWVTADSDAEPVKRAYEPTLMQAVEAELAARGITRAADGPADVIVTYHVLIAAASSAQHMGQFLPPITQFGLPPFAAQTTALSIYPQGTLVLDVASLDASRVVWRAVAQAEVDLDRTEAQRAGRLRKVVHDVLGKLPRK